MDETISATDELLTFFKALADGTRLRMVGLLAEKSLSVEEMAAILGLSPATISHHLQRLAEAGLVERTAQQYYRVYSLKLDTLREMAQRILSRERLKETALDLDLDRYDRKVLRDFLVDGRLKSIPSQRKKRDVILRYLLGQFEPGRRYSEAEVNEIISQFHEDYATIRREFIMTGMMAREGGGGMYWRIA